METLSYCQLMERCLAAEARVVELAAENVALKAAIAEEIEVINRGGQRYCVKDGMSINPMYARGWNDHRANLAAVETPITDHIVASQRSAFVAEAVAKITESGALTFGDCIVALCQLRESTK